MKAILWISSLAAIVVLGLAIAGPPVEAHHNSAPFYDDALQVDVIGTVTRFNFRNPHSFIFLTVENDAGEMVEWEVEMGAAVSMSRNGWTRESIEAGDMIRVVGNPSRAEGTTGMCCARITQPDGSRIQLGYDPTLDVPLRLVVVEASADD